ncbi:hypothetical protein EVAR_17853_1 [Eumeta japonica]|uniref:Uncharacterized protein n=1 Tax=Eumeta variegata TaxID=151549 RepID=A0A4C1TTM4_EUMVA|nr:hypothetical protein EVAR_17853_1 [Eumeta japonica]
MSTPYTLNLLTMHYRLFEEHHHFKPYFEDFEHTALKTSLVTLSNVSPLMCSCRNIVYLWVHCRPDKERRLPVSRRRPLDLADDHRRSQDAARRPRPRQAVRAASRSKNCLVLAPVRGPRWRSGYYQRAG